ncbi:hypothetical protein CTAYLR_008152 [Chrysophaeum taylorii]|uniref:DM2 domain-containing protein n=1 Tax=Chrysophaeum taylorii TaxID=2483200 RepID=A0AAD7XPA2_9STRA|nr:hypothetical protein CTAYLR_008152 [Chrysophaeum taylorii]
MDAAVKKRVKVLVQEGDLSVLTLRSVRQQLEEEFGVDLSEDKAELKACVEEATKTPTKESAWKKKTTKKKSSPKSESKKRKKSDETTTEMSGLPEVSEVLREVVGVARANHFQAVKLLWEYIKGNSLQSETNRNVIVCDDKLRAVFGTESVTSFGMNKLIGKHLTKTTTPSKRPRVSEVEYRGSPELAEFCGTKTNNRFTITKHLWAHIKTNNLQDPGDKRRIVFDQTLQDLFKVKECTAFSLSKLLAQHFE